MKNERRVYSPEASARAELHGVGLFVAIAALFVSGIAAGMAFMVFLSGRDHLAAAKELIGAEIRGLNDEIHKAQTEIKDLGIRIDEMRDRK